MKNLFNKYFIKKTDNIFIQLFRYLFVGGLSFLVDFGILYLLTELGLYYLVSATISFIFGLAVNYLLSVLWIFKKSNNNSKIFEFIVFAVIGVAGLLLNILIIWIFTEKLHIYYLLSKIISTVIVFLFNFFMRKFILFNKKEEIK